MKKASGLASILFLCLIIDQVSSQWQQQWFTPKRIDPYRQQQQHQQQHQSWPHYTIIQNASFMPMPAKPTTPTLIQPIQTTQMPLSIENSQSKGLVKECIEKNGLKSCLMDIFKDKNEVNQIGIYKLYFFFFFFK
jgi:hypothetical protein